MPPASRPIARSAPSTMRSTQASSVTSGQGRDQERREHDEVEAPVEDDGRDPAAVRERAAGDPPGAEQVADATREHVVHGDAGDDHLDELELARAGHGDPAPARRLEPVRRLPCTPSPRTAVAASRPGASARRRRRSRTADREVQEDHRRGDADDGGQQDVAPATPRHPGHKMRRGSPGEGIGDRRSPLPGSSRGSARAIRIGRERPSPLSGPFFRPRGDHSDGVRERAAPRPDRRHG